MVNLTTNMDGHFKGIYLPIRRVWRQTLLLKIVRTTTIMNTTPAKAVTFFCVVMLLICAFISAAEATYRKPPFNGSIFGKRTGNSVNNNEYDSASKALSAMCEIANEACQTWFPITQEK
ncbi:hypothetical protein NQ317_009709 [Molorchus minor]|uniref:SIFamide n=1 Tax=Molorchus minor TaxID=1323400 RepID=A0ABQ9IUA7_9CUCU|nr:hypothetical protein NQ317_009709 [Molorchus minor]